MLFLYRAAGLVTLAVSLLFGMAGGWILTLAAKVQGQAETVRGSVTVKLAK